MHKILTFVAFSSLTFAGAMHFVIESPRRSYVGSDLRGLNTAYALGQVLFGLLALVVGAVIMA